MELLDSISKLIQILFVDLVLAGDNAIVIGMVASRFTPEYRKKVIFWGVGVAVALRVVFALLTVQLLQITGLTLVGGLLLLWICWTLWREMRSARPATAQEISGSENTGGGEEIPVPQSNPPLTSAIYQIIIADLSMSIDNVIAVAGIADGHTGLLVIGLAISILFMMFFATWIANMLEKHRWIGYLGLAVIFYVALKLTYQGTIDILPLLG